MIGKNLISEEEKARKVLERATMRRALWELLWERVHPCLDTGDGRPTVCKSKPRMSDGRVREELRRIVRGL